MKQYKKLSSLPSGQAGSTLTQGTLVLEGGGWKGLYTLGVLDAMMENDFNFSSVVGVSAGALSAMGYVSGQIGWGARIDLTYRHDKNYCGTGALRRDHGITGFSYLYGQILKDLPIDEERLNDPGRRLVVSATNLENGKVEYFEKGKCDIYKAIQASASVPYVSAPVMINGVPFLDGGCAEKIPYSWAKENGEKKVVVVRTRDLTFRRPLKPSKLARRVYHKDPAFVESLENANENYNQTADELEADAASGKIFLIAPSKPVTVKRFEGDMDKLGDLYWLGYHDMYGKLGNLKEYLSN